MDLGGWVLQWIALLLLIMWFMILERVLYVFCGHGNHVKKIMQRWEDRPERRSWSAHRVREQLISEVSVELKRFLPAIQTCVALCPLLGLLGTVTGMIEVFQVMAVSGTGNVRAMAAGVSQATIPTMSGMVAALSGIFFSVWLQNTYKRERELLSERLTLDH